MKFHFLAASILAGFALWCAVDLYTRVVNRRSHCTWTVYLDGPFGPRERHFGDLNDAEVTALFLDKKVWEADCR